MVYSFLSVFEGLVHGFNGKFKHNMYTSSTLMEYTEYVLSVTNGNLPNTVPMQCILDRFELNYYIIICSQIYIYL